jgi:hypothetical protein
MKRFLNYLLIAATVCGISFAAASCSKDDDENNVEALTAERLAGLWVTEYAESGTDGERTWTRALEDYRFNADGTGYYESYLLDGQNYASAVLVRDEGALHFTITGSTVSITDDKTSSHRTLTYADGKLTDSDRYVFQRATAEQQTLVEQLYGEWQKANSGDDDDKNNNLNDVNGNVDVNNGGGGVNVVR